MVFVNEQNVILRVLDVRAVRPQNLHLARHSVGKTVIIIIIPFDKKIVRPTKLNLACPGATRQIIIMFFDYAIV